MRNRFNTMLIAAFSLTLANTVGLVSTTRAEELPSPVFTPLDSATFGPGNLIAVPVDPGIIPDPGITPPDFGNIAFAQNFSPNNFSPNVTTVPEPSAISLAILGAAALVAFAKFRRRLS